MKAKYNVILLGLGKVGMGYDYNLSHLKKIMTHARAFSSHPGFELVAGVDSDEKKRRLFEGKYKKKTFKTLPPECKGIDVFSVATPTDTHFDVLESIIDYHPKAILCEKPFTNAYEKALQIKKRVEKEGIILLVNYMREFEPGVLKIKQQIDKNTLGKIYKVVVKYSSSLLNGASHFIDLMTFLFGSLQFVNCINQSIVFFTSGDIEFVFISVEPCTAPIYEFEIVAEKGVLRYTDAGRIIYTHPVNFNHQFNCNVIDYQHKEMIETDYECFMYYSVDKLYQALQKQEYDSLNMNRATEVLQHIEMMSGDMTNE